MSIKKLLGVGIPVQVANEIINGGADVEDMIRLGVPPLVAEEMASGGADTKDFIGDGVSPATARELNINREFSRMFVYGDSYSVGTGASAGQGFIDRLQSYFGATEDNRALAGNQITAMTEQHRTAEPVKNDVTVYLSGVNDERNIGMDTTKQNAFKTALEHIAAFMSIPHANKIFHGDMTRVGSWTFQDATREAYFATASGATCEGNVVGSTVYLGFYQRLSDRGTCDIYVDDVLKISGYDTSNSFSAETGGDTILGLARITGLSEGTHTVKVEVNGDGVIQPYWFGGCTPGDSTAQVRLMGCTRLPVAGYSASANSDFNNGSDAAADALAVKTREVVDMLSADGLDVHYVSPPTMIDPDDWSGDNIHPNDSGHGKIYSNFIEV